MPGRGAVGFWWMGVLFAALLGGSVTACEDDDPTKHGENLDNDTTPPPDPNQPAYRRSTVVGVGGKILAREYDVWLPDFRAWAQGPLIAPDGSLASAGTVADGQVTTQVAQPASGAQDPPPGPTKAFFAGGFGPNGAAAGDQAFHLDWATETFTPMTLGVPRVSHTLTPLLDGRFLVTGGLGASLEVWRSAEIFDPVSMQIVFTDSMSVPRWGHSEARLPDGRVLIAGGNHNLGAYSSTEIYDPETGEFTAGADMNRVRSGHTATELPDGRILIVGGQGDRSAELFAPATGVFTLLPETVDVHERAHTATLLADGRVLIVGGDEDPAGQVAPSASAEVFDPATLTFTAVGDMTLARMSHFAVLQPDSTVLIGGGTVESGFPTAAAELFDPTTGTFAAVADVPHAGNGQAAVSLVRLEN